MNLSFLLFSLALVSLLIEPLSATQLIVAGAMVVSGALNLYLRTYLTYVLQNCNTNEFYIGRTSGFGEPNKILKRRLYGHTYIKAGFTDVMLDKAMQGQNARFAIRGREQQLIDHYGGIGHPQVANLRRGVAKWNPRARIMHQYSNKYFGILADYSGY